MIKRIIYIGKPSYLRSKKEQLVIENGDTGEINTLPAKDIGVLERITITSQCMRLFAENKTAVILCDQTHTPISLTLPMEGHFRQSRRLKRQAEASLSTKKRLWKHIVKAKILNQRSVLEKYQLDTGALKRNIKNVKSDDSGNMEGISSAHYWKHLFSDKKFRRNPDGLYPNNLLNYGYAVIRAITARAIVTTGLHPSIGLHHKNQYNAFCLADDLMEPYRPYVDEIVMNYYSENKDYEELTRNVKRIILA
jgi:CRISPR-associated protein Cas1